jgi:hypothetical protein
VGIDRAKDPSPFGAQALDPFPAVPERQPSAISADGRQIIATDCPANPLKNLPPGHTVSCFEAKFREYYAILLSHASFRIYTVQGAAVRPTMRTSRAQGIRRREHFNDSLRMCR